MNLIMWYAGFAVSVRNTLRKGGICTFGNRMQEESGEEWRVRGANREGWDWRPRKVEGSVRELCREFAAMTVSAMLPVPDSTPQSASSNPQPKTPPSQPEDSQSSDSPSPTDRPPSPSPTDRPLPDSNLILVGHSDGATHALRVAMKIQEMKEELGWVEAWSAGPEVVGSYLGELMFLPKNLGLVYSSGMMTPEMLFSEYLDRPKFPVTMVVGSSERLPTADRTRVLAASLKLDVWEREGGHPLTKDCLLDPILAVRNRLGK